MFGFTKREWAFFGVGSSLAGLGVAAILRSPGLFIFNAVCLAINVAVIQNAGSEE